MTKPATIDINIVELVTLSSNILTKVLCHRPKNQAKPLFKDLKSGKAVSLGSLTVGKEKELALKLGLDYSEFRGPGFNFDVFKMALESMLYRIAGYVNAKKEFNVLTSDAGAALIHVPGVIQLNQQFNVLVMAFEPDDEKQITLKLMFIDPEQYNSEKTESAEAESK